MIWSKVGVTLLLSATGGATAFALSQSRVLALIMAGISAVVCVAIFLLGRDCPHVSE